MKITSLLFAPPCVCVCALPQPSKPKPGRRTTWPSFDKGTLTGLSLSSEGKTHAGARGEGNLRRLDAPSCGPSRAIPKGNVYAGGGGLGATKAKLFAVDPKGTVKTLAELDGIAIQAIAIDPWTALRRHVAGRQSLSRERRGQSGGFLRSQGQIYLGDGVRQEPGIYTSPQAIRARFTKSRRQARARYFLRPRKPTRGPWLSTQAGI